MSNELSDIKPNEEILEIRHPKTDVLLGVRVGLRSIDDEALQRAKRQIRDAANKLRARGKTFTAAQEEENENLLIFTAMTFWDWYIPEIEPERIVKGTDTVIPAVMGERPTFHGEVPTFNQRTVYKVFEELPWFQAQLAEKCGETKSFFQ